MNTITTNGVSHSFATVPELLALPVMRTFADDIEVSHFGQGNGQLLACKLIEGKPVWHLVGALAQRVVLPASICGAQSQPLKPMNTDTLSQRKEENHGT